ncbi:MAG: shikimate dehydrogenase [Rubrivivax sp.]|jgi:shikimate dehydrogenase|nr:shikimate dehydrogenase [Rubrivivax sp.]
MTDATPPDRYAVLGNPVAHSQSPFIHAEFARQTGQPVEYGRLLVPVHGFAAAVREFAAGGARGCNVTVPFKFEVLPLAATFTPRAALAQAANTLRFDDTGWLADNTDGIGLVRDIVRHAGVGIAGRRVLVVGAGGAAAGVLGPLIEARPRQVVVVNRTAPRAQALVDRHAALAQAHGVALHARPIEAPGRGHDIVINASSSSLHGAAVPVSDDVVAAGGLAVDLMYGSAAAPFLAWARAAGAHARDGLGMLVEQAAEAFHVWRGVMPQTAPVLAALRERVAAGGS